MAVTADGTTVHNAQVALFNMYKAKRPYYQEAYGMMKQYALGGYGMAPILRMRQILDYLRKSNDSTDQAAAPAFAAYMDLTPKRILAVGGLAPPSANPDNVSQSFWKVAKATPQAVTKDAAQATGVDITGFLGRLIDPHTWLRVAEVALGIVLVVVGLVKLAPPGVTKNVKTVAKVAALL